MSFFTRKMWIESIVPIIIQTLLLLHLIDGTFLCPSDQIYQKITKSCCYPVFNCRPGTGVAFCTKNGTKDMCIPCEKGKIQPQLVSSLDDIDAMCFADETEANCNSVDLLPARELKLTCGIRCICNYRNCYYGDDPCKCDTKSENCGFNMTLNKITGECEPCPIYSFKNTTGCGPCYYNEMEWLNGHRYGDTTVFPIFPSILVVNERENNTNTSNNATVPDTKQEETSSGVGISSAAVILASVIVGVGVVILVYAFRRRLNEKCLCIFIKRQNRPTIPDPEMPRPIMEVSPVVQNHVALDFTMHELNSVATNRPAVVLEGDTFANSMSEEEESETHQTYFKEVVNSQTHNVEEGHQRGTTENLLDPVAAASMLPSNDHWSNCSSDSSNKLQEETSSQREEEEDDDDDVDDDELLFTTRLIKY